MSRKLSLCLPNCKPVYNLQQNGLSRKTLISQIIQVGQPINYANSNTANIYTTILSADYDSNRKLLFILKYKLYKKYLNQVISCGKYNSHEILANVEKIISDLTTEEYNYVFEIVTKVDISENDVQREIDYTYYVTVDANRQFFLIKNYNGEYIRPHYSYKFNLEDPTNLNTRFCISRTKNSIRIDGLVYSGVPGTPGAYVIFNAPLNISYLVYTYNALSTDPYSWGYGQPFLPVLQVNQPIYVFSSYIPIATQQKSELSIYYNDSVRFFIQTLGIAFFTTSSVNYNYLFYYGTYYLQVPKIYSIALLNKGQETSIQYKGDINKTSTSSIYGTTNDGIYNFYYDTVIISIYESFTPISMYSQLYGYLGSTNAINFHPDAISSAKPEIRYDHPIDENNIETVYGQTKVYIDFSNNVMTLNNNVINSNIPTVYGVYNGTYIFYTNEYIAFLNKDKEDIFIVSGVNRIRGPGPDGNTNYDFYSGIIQVKILGNFNKLSMYTFNKGYCNGRYMLNYHKRYNNYLPHSYAFTNISITDLNDPAPITYTDSMQLNSTTRDFTDTILVVNGTTSGNPITSYNVIQNDNLGNIVFTQLTNSDVDSSGNLIPSRILNNKIPYSSTKQYTMTNGTYVFFNMSDYYITFMTKNKSVTSNGKNVGVYYFIGTAPNGDEYIFNKSDSTSIALLKPIIVTVTGNFGYLSISTPNGYNGGQNLITYSR
jgi:hypothetical protein